MDQQQPDRTGMVDKLDRETGLPKGWLLALKFVKHVKKELPPAGNREDYPALISLLIHLIQS